MLIEDVRNNHLLKVIGNLDDSSLESLDDDELIALKRELSLSTFLCAGNGDDIAQVVIDDEGNSALPLFTSIAEFDIRFLNRDFQPVSFDFTNCIFLMDDELFKGVVINPNMDDFFIDKEMVVEILEAYPDFTDYDDKMSKLPLSKIKKIFLNKNEKIDDLLNDVLVMDELFEELSKIQLFTILTDLGSKKARNKFIKLSNVNSNGIYTVNELGGEYNLVFTSTKYMKRVAKKNREFTMYAFPTTIELMAKYVIELDLDGIILNYGSQNVDIPREILLKYLDYIAKCCSENVEILNNDFVYLL